MKRISSIVMTTVMVIHCALLTVNTAKAHDQKATATYLGNEGVLINSGHTKIVFDPFFHNSYNTYQLVPEEIRSALFNNQAPYDDIDAIFVSHAHGDHFSAQDMLDYLKKYQNTKLIAPKQAVEKILTLDDSTSVAKQITAIELKFGDQPQTLEFEDLLVEAVRIPHAGWPSRAEISNLVFRVTLDDELSVIHMGDADPNDSHYSPYKKYWQKTQTNTAFPPYWFFDSFEGNYILENRLNANHAIGIHVPVKVPLSLKNSEHEYFSTPGQTTVLKSKK